MYVFAAISARLHTYLQQQTAAVSQYQLLQMLDSEGYFVGADNLSASLRLFHKHFVTMHCLYTLRRQLYPRRMDIDPMAIRLHQGDVDAATATALSDDVARLADYYLDLDHLHGATEDTVAQLLGQFWQRFDARDDAAQAFALLGLEAGASWPQVKEAYRQQVQQAHPDKGGNSAWFAQVREAYQVLKRHFH